MLLRFNSATVFIICQLTALPADTAGKIDEGEDTSNHNKDVFIPVTMVVNSTFKELAGRTKNFKCPISFRARSLLQWLKEEEGHLRPYGNTDQRTITLKDMTVADSGTYVCKLCNVNSCALAFLEVIVKSESDDDKELNKPFIQFRNSTIRQVEGRTANLTCLVPVAHEKPKFEWFKENEGQLKPYGKSEDQWRLVLEHVTMADSGTYTCKSCATLICSLSYLQLTVISENEESEVTSNDDKYFVSTDFINITLEQYVGNNDVLMCPSDDGESLLQWFKADQGQLRPYRSGKSLKYLSINDLTMADSGTYACKYCNVKTCGMTYFEFTVKSESEKIEDIFNHKRYLVKPIVHFSSNTLTSFEGRISNLNCFSSNEPSSYEWFKEDEEHWQSYAKGGGLRVLTLQNLTLRDSGTFACLTCFPSYCGLAYFELTVLSEGDSTDNKDVVKPVVWSFDETIKEFEGRAALLGCFTSVGSEIMTTFEWFKEDEGKWQTYGNTKGPANLTLDHVTMADSGIYVCRSCNAFGCALYSYQLEVMKFVATTEEPSATTDYKATTTEQPFSGSSTTTKKPQSSNVVSGIGIKLASGLGLLLLFGASYVVFSQIKGFCRKKERDKTRKRLAREIYLAAKHPHWTKKVIVERQTFPTNEQTPASRKNDTDILVMPSVRIEMQMLRNHGGQLPKYELPFDPDWEVPMESLTMGRVLGEGAFGKVMQAEARRVFQERNVTTVAVKMLKDNHTDDDLVQFVKEMELMKMLGKHSNIVNLLGCCTQDGPLLVVIEFAPHGNVRDFLRRHRSCLRISKECNCLTERDLVSFAYQVAKGMDYLASRKYIHGDLAARNVLISDDYVVKISDFGLARKLQQKDYYRKKMNGLLPIKWLAPESLFDNVYTTQSDVWSYGILLWEIMTMGGSPYPSVAKIGKLYKMLKGGYRMEKPEHCTLEMYSVMKECWKYKPSERPPFGKLVEVMNDFLSATTTMEYLDLLPAEEAEVTPATPDVSEEPKGKEDVSLPDTDHLEYFLSHL